MNTENYTIAIVLCMCIHCQNGELLNGIIIEMRKPAFGSSWLGFFENWVSTVDYIVVYNKILCMYCEESMYST